MYFPVAARAAYIHTSTVATMYVHERDWTAVVARRKEHGPGRGEGSPAVLARISTAAMAD